MCSAKRSRSVLMIASMLALAPVFASCADQPLPGTVYGMYKVTGTTTTNTCGGGLGAPDPWVFDAQLSRDGDTLYWSWMDGSAPLSGPLSGSAATLSTNESANVDETDAGLGPCTMTRADSLTLTFASGSPPSTFSGTIGYAFTVVSGSTCGDQLTSSGGTYATLPCSIAYSVTAAIQ